MSFLGLTTTRACERRVKAALPAQVKLEIKQGERGRYRAEVRNAAGLLVFVSPVLGHETHGDCFRAVAPYLRLGA